MVVPPYVRSRGGRLFRLLRSSALIADNRVRYTLRAQLVGGDVADAGVELTRELDISLVLDKIAHGHAIPTPEMTFEELWQQLRQDLDDHYG